jgi:type I restriction enzyme, S subunit
MSDKKALVPKLRFPEFRGASGWQPKRLGLALKFQAGFPFPSAGFNDARKGLRLIRNRDLRSDDIVIFYSGEADSNFVVKNGDVLVGMDGDFTPTVWEKGDALLNQRVGRIHPGGDSDQKFLLYLLTLTLRRIEDATARTTVKHLSHSAVEDRDEPIPSPAEQQKIAECLSSVDELMAAQARKVDALKTHKKGLMQQLFPREGETQPHFRFPEFQNAGDWEVRKAGSLFTNRVTKGEKGLPLYSVTMYDGMVRRDSLDRNYYDIEDATGNKKVCRDDIAYNMMRMWQGALGVAPEDCLVSPAYIVLAPVKGTVPVFFQFLFKLPETLRVLTSHSRGLTKDRLRLYYDDFARIQLLCPAAAEQQRIVDCLTSLDDLIAAQTQKHEALKTHKKGLMQQIFPSPETEA